MPANKFEVVPVPVLSRTWRISYEHRVKMMKHNERRRDLNV